MAAPAQFTFTYGGVGPHRVVRYNFHARDGMVEFNADFRVKGTSEAEFQSDLAAALGMAKRNQTAVFAQGGTNILEWTPGTNTGFLTECEVIKPGSPGDGPFECLLRVVIRTQKEPAESSRNGRREANITLTRQPDELRLVRLEGTWTAVTSSAAKAVEAYDTNAQTWFDSILDSIDSDASWQFIGGDRTWDDEKGLLRFSVTYKEAKFIAALSSGIAIHGAVQVVDPGVTGQRTTSSTTNSEPPRRFAAEAVVVSTNKEESLNTLWTSVVRPWIEATVKAEIGNTRLIFAQPMFTFDHIDKRQVRAAVQLMAADHGAVIEVSERSTQHNPRNMRADHVYSGKHDQYDINELGRELRLTREITITRLDVKPARPAPLGPPWQWEVEEEPRTKQKLDPLGSGVLQFTTTWRETYLYANPEATVVLQPAPLGPVITPVDQFKVPPEHRGL